MLAGGAKCHCGDPDGARREGDGSAGTADFSLSPFLLTLCSAVTLCSALDIVMLYKEPDAVFCLVGEPAADINAGLREGPVASAADSQQKRSRHLREVHSRVRRGGLGSASVRHGSVILTQSSTDD